MSINLWGGQPPQAAWYILSFLTYHPSGQSYPNASAGAPHFYCGRVNIRPTHPWIQKRGPGGPPTLPSGPLATRAGNSLRANAALSYRDGVIRTQYVEYDPNILKLLMENSVPALRQADL